MSDENVSQNESEPQKPNDFATRRPRLNYAELGDSPLVEAMRAKDPRAIEEFILRHERLVSERARLAGLRHRDAADCVRDVVRDVAMRIVARRIRPTRAVGAYVAKCFFNRLADIAAEEKRQSRFVSENSEDAPGSGERAMMSLVSEGSIRDSQGPAWECLPLAEPLQRLAEMIEEGLSRDEEQLLGWHSRYVPLRQIAEWLGISYAAAAKRSWRLRETLRELARRYALSFTPKERTQLANFFDRCAATYDPDLRSGTDDPPTRSA
jgi:hypothetical protein